MKIDPNNIVAWVLILLVPLLTVLALTTLLQFLDPGIMSEVVREHFAAVVGLPIAALVAAFIVVALRHSEGPMKFKGFGMKFEGASGQVILWVITFLSISAAIKLLW